MSGKSNQIEGLKQMVLEAAEQAREDAGFSGRLDDGGAGRMKDQVKFYEYGQRGVVPTEWEKHLKKLDPEWEEFQRLKKRFEP